MKLKEHYLPEDIWKASDELVNIQKTCIKVLDSALNGQFTNKESLLQDIDHSLKTLIALNKKKVALDKHGRRN